MLSYKRFIQGVNLPLVTFVQTQWKKTLILILGKEDFLGTFNSIHLFSTDSSSFTVNSISREMYSFIYFVWGLIGVLAYELIIRCEGYHKAILCQGQVHHLTNMHVTSSKTLPLCPDTGTFERLLHLSPRCRCPVRAPSLFCS